MSGINSPQTEFDLAINRFIGTEDWSRRFYSQAREITPTHVYTFYEHIIYVYTCITRKILRFQQQPYEIRLSSKYQYYPKQATTWNRWIWKIVS